MYYNINVKNLRRRRIAMNRRSWLIIVLIAVIALAGCKNMKKYDPLMNDAKAALESAKQTEGAEDEQLKEAEAAFKSAQEAYEGKKGDDVEIYANKTIELANKAKADAIAAKKEAERIIVVKDEYETKLADLTAAVDEIKTEKEIYQKTLDLIEQAKAEYEAGEYDKALETLTMAMDTFNRGLEIKKNKPTAYTVIKGDCLWNIAKKEKIYGDPFQWPKIYKENKDQIRDPDLIFPKQVFRIPR